MTTRRETTFIYVLIDPRTLRIRYVGKADDLKVRFGLHTDSVQLQGRTHKNNWVKSLCRVGLKPWMIVIEEVKVVEWQDRERYWIKTLREWGCDLTNMTDGGEGLSKGFHHSEETRRKQRELWRTGVPAQKARETRRRRKEERRQAAQQKFEEGMIRGFDFDCVATDEDLVGDEPSKVLTEEEWIDRVLDAFGKLRQRELEVLRIRYGGCERVTLKEVGRRLRYTDGWVLQQERAAIAALAEHLKGVEFPGWQTLKNFQCFLNLGE